MAAPAYTWKFVYDLWGDRVPKVVTLEAASSLDTVAGTLLVASSGQLAAAGASSAEIIGIALETVTGDGTSSNGDPVKLELIAPGMVIRGTADADASSLQGFTNKTIDTNAAGDLDVADTTNGCLSVYRVNNSAGTEVDCVVTTGALIEA